MYLYKMDDSEVSIWKNQTAVVHAAVPMASVLPVKLITIFFCNEFSTFNSTTTEL